MGVYVDTSAWIALHERRDKNHGRASATVHRLAEANEVLVTGWHTLIELCDGMVRHHDQGTAALALGRLLASPRLRVEGSEPHLDAALEYLRSRTDWNVDMSDCLSFAMMDALKLKRVFTYDGDFEKAGFVPEP